MSLNPQKAQGISFQQAEFTSMMKLLRKLRRTFSIDAKARDRTAEISDSDLDSILMVLVASTGLAHRGILPKTLVDTDAGMFTRLYGTAAGLEECTVDETTFAENCSIWMSGYANHPFIKDNCPSLIKIFTKFAFAANLAHPLALGWFQQCLVKESALPENIREGHRVRADLRDLRLLTQWFTPEWIANFLVEQSIELTGDATFFDPACGAGHLLIPALERFWMLSNKGVSDLRSILESQLFGADIDDGLVQIAKFAVYLKARDLLKARALLETRSTVKLEELPPPRIFSLRDQANGSGSLSLGIGKHLPDLNFPVQFDKQFLDLDFPVQFDAIAMNPPYLGHRTMPKPVRDFLKQEYPTSQYDLFAAFIELGIRLLKPDRRMSAICQQSILTIQRYEPLRSAITSSATIESLVQLGSGVFATKGGEKTNNAIVTFRKNPNTSVNPVSCWQLLTRHEKLQAELEGINSIPHTTIARASADAIAKQLPTTPFAYWAPNEILRLFSTFPPLMDDEHGITCTNGLFTCNNAKFVRRFDEVPESLKAEYVSYDKGGGHKWFRTSDLMLHWKDNGNEIREYRKQRGQSASLPGEAHYFKPGVTYSYIGTRGFKARLLSPNSVFDVASSAIFSDRVSIYYILGLLNSSLTRCILGVLNPTINFQIGDIRRIPFQFPTLDVEQKINTLVIEATSLAKMYEQSDPSSPAFAGHAKSHDVEEWAQREKAIQTEIDDIMFNFHEISNECRKQILVDPWVTRCADPWLTRSANALTTRSAEPCGTAAARHFSDTQRC